MFLGFYESPFWKDSDPESGLGDWGNPDEDFSMRYSGFNSFQLSYPSPYTAPRRNFTLHPFEYLSSALQQFFFDHDKAANSSFLAPQIAQLLESSAGTLGAFKRHLRNSR